MCYLLEWPYNTFLSKLITIRSEYTVGEQLSKLYLFTIVLVSVLSYRILTDATKIKLSISFLLLSLIMYMSESNMITEEAQPIYGLIGGAFTGYYLFRLRSWLCLSLFIGGFSLILCGSLTDFTHENETIHSLVPPFIFHILNITSEERFDVTGIGLFCLSAILCFRIPLLHFITRNKIGSVLLLLSSATMTSGNGFLHYQYRPGMILYFVALVMTIGGCLGVVFTNKYINKTYPGLMLVTEDFFYLFIVVFFVLLPSTHGTARSSTALFLWLPSMIFMAVYFWQSHSVHHIGVDRNNIE